MVEFPEKPCNCNDPFPCVFPVPDDGVMCDNCGGWLTVAEGTKAGEEILQEIGKRLGEAPK